MAEYNDNLHGNAKGFAYENARHLRQAQTPAEAIMWQAIRGGKVSNLKFRRQHPFGKYVLDFYCHELKLAIEVDGSIHNEKHVSEYDKARTIVLNENGITVVRFTNEEVENNIKVVTSKIEEWKERLVIAKSLNPPTKNNQQ